MKTAVLCAALTVFLLVTALLYRTGQRWDATKTRLREIKENEKDFGVEELKKPFAERVFKPFADKLAGFFKRLAGRNPNAKVSKNALRLEKMLKSAAIPLSATEFTLIKSAFMLLLAGCGFIAFLLLKQELLIRLLVLLVFLIVSILAPSYYLKGRIRRRKESIVRDLPDVMDLLVVSIEAGLGLDAAIARLYTKNKCTVLQELMGTVRDMQRGVPRKLAMREMAERCDVKELTSFVTALIQAEQLGVAMKNVLIAQADRLREERRQRVKEKALKAPVKIMLPTVLFIFPVMFIILLEPAMMNLMEIFK